MIQVLELSDGRKVLIEGGEITAGDAQEIIISLTKTWGTDFEKHELKDKLMDLAMGLTD